MPHSLVQSVWHLWLKGIIFIVLSLTNVREAIFNAIPLSLKHAVSVGIGLFIAFIGLQNAKLAVDNSSTLVSMVSFRENFSTSGICALLAIIGSFITTILYIKNSRVQFSLESSPHGFSAKYVSLRDLYSRL